MTDRPKLLRPAWAMGPRFARLTAYQQHALTAGYNYGQACARYGNPEIPEDAEDLVGSSWFDEGFDMGLAADVVEDPDADEDTADEPEDDVVVTKRSARDLDEMPAWWYREHGSQRVPSSEDIRTLSRGAYLAAHPHGFNAPDNDMADETAWHAGPVKTVVIRGVTVESTPTSRLAAAREREEAADGVNPRTGGWRPWWEDWAPQDPREAATRWRASTFKTETGRKAGQRRSRAKTLAARLNAQQPRPRGRRPRRKRS